MLTALFLSLIIAALALHFFLVERPRRKAAEVEPVLPEPRPVDQALRSLPELVFLQTNFTWVHLLPDGRLLLGLHPVIISLVGAPYRLELIPEGWNLAKGRPLLRVFRGDRHLQIRSPVSGKIVEVNPHACQERGWSHPRNAEECWVYRVDPEHLLWDLNSWLQGEEAEAWLRTSMMEIGAFLADASGEDPPQGPEEIHVGALAKLDQAGWRAFEEEFLLPAEGGPGLRDWSGPRLPGLGGG